MIPIIYNRIRNLLITRLLLVNGSWLVAQGSPAGARAAAGEGGGEGLGLSGGPGALAGFP